MQHLQYFLSLSARNQSRTRSNDRTVRLKPIGRPTQCWKRIGAQSVVLTTDFFLILRSFSNLSRSHEILTGNFLADFGRPLLFQCFERKNRQIHKMENENLVDEKTDEKVKNSSENVTVKKDSLEEVTSPRESMVNY